MELWFSRQLDYCTIVVAAVRLVGREAELFNQNVNVYFNRSFYLRWHNDCLCFLGLCPMFAVTWALQGKCYKLFSLDRCFGKGHCYSETEGLWACSRDWPYTGNISDFPSIFIEIERRGDAATFRRHLEGTAARWYNALYLAVHFFSDFEQRYIGELVLCVPTITPLDLIIGFISS